jgi:hypothetical protein
MKCIQANTVILCIFIWYTFTIYIIKAADTYLNFTSSVTYTPKVR